jgi:hypothetical protein
MKTKTYEIESDFGPYWVAEVEITGIEVDASFDHEFGTRYVSEAEITAAGIVSVTDQEGADVELSEKEEKNVLAKAYQRFYDTFHD